MADFISDLWGSVFTPGATPTLLIATNATFGMLQLVLAALLAATYSIHFLILSLLCAGLWWSINWFAMELRQAQAKEEEAERIRKSRQKDSTSTSNWRTSGEVGDSADDEGTGTEREADAPDNDPSRTVEKSKPDKLGSLKSSVAGAQGTGLAPPKGESRRRTTGSDMSGEISTDSEWEKVEDER